MPGFRSEDIDFEDARSDEWAERHRDRLEELMPDPEDDPELDESYPRAEDDDE